MRKQSSFFPEWETRVYVRLRQTVMPESQLEGRRDYWLGMECGQLVVVQIREEEREREKLVRARELASWVERNSNFESFFDRHNETKEG